MARNKIKATEFQKNSLVSIITHTITPQNFFHIVRLCGSMKSTKTSNCNLVFFLAARILWNKVFLDLVWKWFVRAIFSSTFCLIAALSVSITDESLIHTDPDRVRFVGKISAALL
jgi:hypothetical protein